jgi:hypothetical protein
MARATSDSLARSESFSLEPTASHGGAADEPLKKEGEASDPAVICPSTLPVPSPLPLEERWGEVSGLWKAQYIGSLGERPLPHLA